MIKCTMRFLDERRKWREPVQLELPFDKKHIRKWWNTIPTNIYLDFEDKMHARWVNSRVYRDDLRELNGKALLRGFRLFKLAVEVKKARSKMGYRYERHYN